MTKFYVTIRAYRGKAGDLPSIDIHWLWAKDLEDCYTEEDIIRKLNLPYKAEILDDTWRQFNYGPRDIYVTQEQLDRDYYNVPDDIPEQWKYYKRRRSIYTDAQRRDAIEWASRQLAHCDASYDID